MALRIERLEFVTVFSDLRKILPAFRKKREKNNKEEKRTKGYRLSDAPPY